MFEIKINLNKDKIKNKIKETAKKAKDAIPESVKTAAKKTADNAIKAADKVLPESVKDFAKGASQDIDAICEDGKVVPVFRGGNWAF